MLRSKTNSIIKHKKYKNGWFYLRVILCIVICVMIYIKVQAFIEEDEHKNWVKQKKQEFRPVIELAYGVMKGEKRIPDTSPNPLSCYDISRYGDYQEACRIEADIEVVDIVEIAADKKYIIKVIYTHRLTDKNGRTVGASIGIESEWTVKKLKNGAWRIVEIYELA